MKIRTMIMEGPDEFKATFYEPQCKYGFTDCIYDNGYIKAKYPEWYKKLQQMTGVDACDVCKDGNHYDDEDK